MADAKTAEIVITKYVPADFKIESLKGYSSNPMAYEWVGVCPDGRACGGIVLLHSHEEHSVCIHMVRDPRDPHDEGWSFPRRWIHGVTVSK